MLMVAVACIATYCSAIQEQYYGNAIVMILFHYLPLMWNM